MKISFRRNISLYYGSISISRSFHFLISWIVSPIRNADFRRERLMKIIQENYFPDSNVYGFGSARSSLAFCLEAAGIGPGDEVLISSFTCLAVPTAIITAGATPVYTDINPQTLNVDTEVVIKAVSNRTKAIVLQHTMGKSAPLQSIIEYAKSNNLLLIEDCALSPGTKLNGRYLCSFGDAAIVSMELSKTLSVGWGGILIVNNLELNAKVSERYEQLPEARTYDINRDFLQTFIASWCYHPALYSFLGKYVLYAGFKFGLFRRSTPPHEFQGKVIPGQIFKIAGLQSAMAAYQWKNFAPIISSCQKNSHILKNVLNELKIVSPGSSEIGEEQVPLRVSFLVNDKPAVVDYFQNSGIELGQWFDGPLSPVPTNPIFNYKEGNYPNAEYVAKKIVNIPCHHRISRTDIEHICNTLRNFNKDYPTKFVHFN